MKLFDVWKLSCAETFSHCITYFLLISKGSNLLIGKRKEDILGQFHEKVINLTLKKIGSKGTKIKRKLSSSFSKKPKDRTQKK